MKATIDNYRRFFCDEEFMRLSTRNKLIKMKTQGTTEHFGALRARLASPVLCLAIIAFFSAQMNAQAAVAAAPQTNTAPNAHRENDKPVNLFHALNLSPEQQAQIKAIRRQNREARLAAAQRVQQALRNLDEVIYADALNESSIDERRRELAAAQAESVRVETAGQLNIRRVLTPEQLGTLRGLRQQTRAARDARRATQGQQRIENANNPNLLRPRGRFGNRRRNMQGNMPAVNNINNPMLVPRERPARPQRAPRP